MSSLEMVLGMIAAALLVGVVVLYATLQKSKKEQEALKQECEAMRALEIELAALKSSSENLKEQLEVSLRQTKELQEEKDRLVQNGIRLQAKMDALAEANEKLKEHYEEQSQKLQLTLNELMQKTLEKKIEKFDENSTKSLQNILKPFAETVESFKKKLNETEEKNAKRFTELSKEIEFIGKTSASLTQEAQNLAEALKGKKQSTGAWGEMILDSVLEYSGLLENIHYEKQNSYRDEAGDLKRPDVVIKLPGNRSIIIDSKVSLVDYDEFVRAQSEEEQNIAAKKLVEDFRNHIDILSSKEYTHYDIGTLQYVFMFVPIEGAFATALQYEPSLYEYALKRHIAIVTPSTLTVSLRTIYLYWQSERSSEFAKKLFEEAGKLYDKVVLFANSFEKVGSQLQTVQKSYDQAYSQLATGSGNVLKRVANLKTLGAKTTKNLKDSKIEYDDFDQEQVEVVQKIEKKDEE